MRLVRAMGILLGLTAVGLGVWILATTPLLGGTEYTTNAVFGGIIIGLGIGLISSMVVIKEDKGLRVYKEELREYLKHSEELKKRYGDLNYPAWDDTDYTWVKTSSAELRAMERVLGLSEKQVKQIEEEIKISLSIK